MGSYSTVIFTTNEMAEDGKTCPIFEAFKSQVPTLEIHLGFLPFRAIAYCSVKGHTIGGLMNIVEDLAITMLDSRSCVQVLAEDDGMYNDCGLMLHYDLTFVDAQDKHSWVKRK